MSISFKSLCSELERPHARACFGRAMRLNRIAHGANTRGRRVCFKMKTLAVEQAIRLAPDALYVDDFQLPGGGTIGVSWPGVGRLHVKLKNLASDTRQWVWKQICLQCARAVDGKAA